MNESELIKLSIDKARQDRYLQLLLKPKKRKELLDKLNHNPPLCSKNTKWLSSFNDVLAILNINPRIEVRLISSAPELDGKLMTFNKAVEEVPYYDWGTIIGISSTLAIYYGEAGERAAIITKNV
tara:strand:- start:253 stop:627 length:375 start_codon:yes stop_codon:yes gene_type:complete